MKFVHPKIILDPLWGIIDITDFLPVIDTPQFQKLGFKYQLGVADLVYPAATHTRKQHSFGAYHRTKILTNRWVEMGFIGREDAKLANCFGLLHDIGHGPFSHVIESVTKERWGRDHDDNGARMLDGMKESVRASGIDHDGLKKMFGHSNPLYLAVHDKNLGSEKLDYLSRDAFYTIGEVPGVDYLAFHTYFIDGKVMIDARGMDQAKAIQEFYVKMFKNVYLRKNSLIGQRFIQKITDELLRTSNVSEDQFWSLTDYGLLGLFENSASSLVKKYYRLFLERQIPKTAVALRPDKFKEVEKGRPKQMAVFGLDEELMQKIVTSPSFTELDKLRAAETAIARIADVPEDAILIVPPINSHRFVPQDIQIYNPNGQHSWLSQHFENHFKALAEEGKSYVVLRICVLPEYREKLSQPKVAESVKEYVAGLAG